MSGCRTPSYRTVTTLHSVSCPTFTPLQARPRGLPQYPESRHWGSAQYLSRWAKRRQSASQQNGPLFDHVVGNGEQRRRDAKPKASVSKRLSGIRSSIGAENPIPEKMNDRKIAVGVPVMNEVQLLFAPEPCEPLKSRFLRVVFVVKQNVCIERCRPRNYHHRKKTLAAIRNKRIPPREEQE